MVFHCPVAYAFNFELDRRLRDSATLNQEYIASLRSRLSYYALAHCNPSPLESGLSMRRAYFCASLVVLCVNKAISLRDVLAGVYILPENGTVAITAMLRVDLTQAMHDLHLDRTIQRMIATRGAGQLVELEQSRQSVAIDLADRLLSSVERFVSCDPTSEGFAEDVGTSAAAFVHELSLSAEESVSVSTHLEGME